MANVRKWFATFLKSNLLVILMLLGVLLGVAIGAGLNEMEPKLNNKQILYLRFPGDLFIQLMKMLIIPIVVSSLVTSTAEMDIRSSGKIGLRAFVYYLSTMVLASTLGMALAVTIRPGDRNKSTTHSGSRSYGLSSNPVHAFLDLLRNMVPENLIEVGFLVIRTEEMHTRAGTDEDDPHPVDIRNSSLREIFDNISEFTNPDQDVPADEIPLVIKKVPGTNMIGLVVASIMFGCAISAVGEEARPLLKIFAALQAVSFKLISICIWTSPVGIAFLIASKLAQIEDLSETFQNLAIFSATVLCGLLLHTLVTLPLIYFIFVRSNPFKVLQGMVPAAMFAFGSDSSSATLPLTIKCLQENNAVDPRIAKLIASVGAAINMDGSCLFHSVTPVFVAQLSNIPLSAGDYLTIWILALSIAAGASGAPGTGVVYILMMLTAMDLPVEYVSLLLAVDWFLSRSRASVNVIGDAFGAGIIEHLSIRELRQMDTHTGGNNMIELLPTGEESVKLTRTE